VAAMNIPQRGKEDFMNSVLFPRSRSQINPHYRKEKAMRKRLYVFALASVLLPVGSASAQDYPIMEKVVQKVLEKYQTSSCEQLAAEKSQPPTGKKAQIQDRAVDMMHKDPQMRTAFINQVAAPIANKLFECGMIP
jgi:hypothetical protein